MAVRDFQIYSVGSNLLEGVSLTRGEPDQKSFHSSLIHNGDGEHLVSLLQQFDQHLSGESIEGKSVILVFPSEEISIRKLHFPFNDQKKISQALVYELENELLEDVNLFKFDYTILPQPDGSAEVLIYLISRDFLDAILQVCESRKCIPVKAVFSAQALLEIAPPKSSRHYYIYAGLDEIFVSCVLDNRIHSLIPVPLDWDRGGPPPENPGPLAETEPQPDGNPEGDEPNASTPESETGAQAVVSPSTGLNDLDEQEGKMLLKTLQTALDDISAFILPHSMGESFTLSLHGRLAALVQWNETEKTLTTLDSVEILEAGFPGRTRFSGVISELIRSPLALADTQQINFHHGKAEWLSFLSEYKRPLITSGSLLVLFLLISLTGFFMKVSEYNSRLEKAETSIQVILKKNLKGNHPIQTGIRILEEKAGTTGRGSGSAARFGDYDYDTMNIFSDVSGVFKKFPNLSLDSFSLNNERFSITGETDSYQGSENFKNELLQLKWFQGKEPTLTHQRSNNKITYRLVINR